MTIVSAGAKLVDAGSWRSAPSDAYIIGLKELPEGDDSPLIHHHIMFAHCFKRQQGWAEVLARFDKGKGTLLDLEFLNDQKGRRVAAFGYYAGYAGAAMGVDLWCHQQLNPYDLQVMLTHFASQEPYPSMKPFDNENDLNAYVAAKLKQVGMGVSGTIPNVAAAASTGRKLPTVMVMGALGRCGSGACDFARRVGIPEDHIIKWDINETKVGGPFKEITENDIFVNCIYLSAKIPPFVTPELLQYAERRLRVLVDVSCDTTNPNNPIPVYTRCTTFDDPVEHVVVENGPPLDVISIDHLPTLLPREASEFFVRDLMPSLLQLPDWKASQTWVGAEAIFLDKLADARNASL
ncbi:Saccharopine dehydrogenase [Phlyctochytrium bullatum]|nr:Saccharopine dehydrogenase [Phlyctochytrium bullatum]